MGISTTWQPHANTALIRQRAKLYQQIRQFMDASGVLEVDTPALSRFGISDPFIDSVKAQTTFPELQQLYLHTSPEFCMKRLLAAGSGDIYQIAHVYRNGELGSRHSIEFVMLEWYRLGMDYRQLMQEVSELLVLLGLPAPERQTYRQVFQQTLQLDPVEASLASLTQIALQAGWDKASQNRHELLDFIFSHIVIKKIKKKKSLIIYDYPACMAALARLKQDEPAVSERFELFLDGMEIANGFTELTDAEEQRQRFLADLEQRNLMQKHQPPLDEFFLASLQAGLPDCAGVAIGLDRLLMVLADKHEINEVNSFTLANN